MTGRANCEDAASSAKSSDPKLPGVFLMTDSFDTGGSERQFAALAGSLDTKLFNVNIGCIAKHGSFLEGLGEVAEFPLGGNLYGVRSLRTRLRLAQDLRRSRISVAHAFDFYTNLTLIPAARVARVPVVIGSQRQLGDLLTPAKWRAQLIIFGWCDRVVCNSRCAADRLIAQGIPERRITVIHNGFPLSTFAPTAPALPLRPAVLRVGMIARMNSASKNHRMFLRAAARVQSRFPKVRFVLVGDGPLRPGLEREASDLGIRDQVCFLGDRRDIPGILASLDVSILPSNSESLSNVVIESMAAGVPVIASQVGGNPELITESRGILVTPGDVQSLAAAVERLLHDPFMRAELGNNGKKFAEQHFTLEEMRRHYEELYNELLAQKTPRRSRPLIRHGDDAPNSILRVAIVAASPRYVGGQSVQADLLVTHWQNEPAIKAHLLPIDPVLPRGLRWVERIPFLRTLIREPFYLWSLWRGFDNVDVAHIFSASYWSFLIAPAPAWLIARMRGVKTVIHYHSGELRDHLRRFRTAQPILSRTDLLVVPSEHLLSVFREAGLRAQVVPNLVGLSQFTFRARRPLRPHLVCTRGFHPYYNVGTLVRAFAQVKEAHPEARLDLVGGGAQEAQIRGLVKELNLTNVNFSGVAPHQTIGTFYDQADIFINSSLLDNMPVSILEAFASGTPVVSTAPEGMRYLVEHERTGLLSEPGDPVALARNVIRLLQNPDLSSRIAHNAHQECSRYCWPEVRGQWLELYHSLARSV